MHLSYHTVGKQIAVAVPLADVSIESRRALLTDLLNDREVCPGQNGMSTEARHQAQQSFGLWLGF